VGKSQKKSVPDEGESAAEVLRRAIQESGLSLNELGRRTGVPPATLSRFMTGKRTITLAVFDRVRGAVGLRLVRR